MLSYGHRSSASAALVGLVAIMLAGCAAGTGSSGSISSATAPAASSSESSEANDPASASTAASEAATGSDEPGAVGGCGGFVSDSEVSSLFGGIDLTAVSEEDITRDAPELAPGLTQNACGWRVPGKGAIPPENGRIWVLWGEYPNAEEIAAQLEAERVDSGGQTISGLGDTAWTFSDPAIFGVMASEGTRYAVVVAAYGEGPGAEEAVIALARTVLDRP